MCAKFQGQKIFTKEDIDNVPTCLVVGNYRGNHFTTTIFDTLPRAKKLSIYHEFFFSHVINLEISL